VVNPLIIIFVFCLVIIPIYFKTTKFNGFWGILMFILGFTALFLRLSILKDYPFLGGYNKETILPSFLLIGGPAIVFMFFGIFAKNFRKRIRRLRRLILPYVLFGGLQQIFFLWVFTDTFYYLFQNINFVFLTSFLFFMIFHLTGWSSIKRFWFLPAVFGVINNWVYLIWGNIFPQILIHGLVGSVLFTEFTNHDEIKERLG